MHPNFRWVLHLHRGASAVIYVKHSWNIYEAAKIAKMPNVYAEITEA